MSIKEVLTKILNWIKYPHLHGQVGLDTYYRVTNTDNNTAVAFGIGSSGTRHGVWSTTMGKWMLYSDGTSVYVNEMKVADTVVEEGTSGVWTYRKWNSGMAECWCSTSTSSLTWTAYMASPSVDPYLYYSSGWNFNLPFAMTDSSYVINATCLVVGPNFGWVARGSKTTSSFILYIIRNGNSGSCSVDVSVKGRWK